MGWSINGHRYVAGAMRQQISEFGTVLLDRSVVDFNILILLSMRSNAKMENGLLICFLGWS